LRRITIEIRRDIAPILVLEGIVSGKIPRPIGSIALVASFLMFGVGVIAAASTGRADDCFAAPNSPAPQGIVSTLLNTRLDLAVHDTIIEQQPCAPVYSE